MKDHNLLTQKLALIASNAVLSDTVVSALDDAVALLNEYRDEIDKLRRHNASLVANGIQTTLRDGEIKTNALKNARMKVEHLLNEDSYKPDTMQYMYYCFGIRDACWAIDKLIDGYQRHEISEETI